MKLEAPRRPHLHPSTSGIRTTGRSGSASPTPWRRGSLALSFQAASTGPIVMMSQNRQSAKDRRPRPHTHLPAPAQQTRPRVRD
jgi:hypothetical protein